MTRPPAPHIQQLIIETTLQLIVQRGIHQVTFDAIAQESQISKGGILHYYKNKSALFEAVILYLIADFQKRIMQQLTNDYSDSPGRWTRAYIRSMSQQNLQEQRLSRALARIVTTDSHLMDVFKKSFEEVQNQLLEDGLPIETALFIRMALDGLWFSDVFELLPLDATQRTLFIQTLYSLTEAKK